MVLHGGKVKDGAACGQWGGVRVGVLDGAGDFQGLGVIGVANRPCGVGLVVGWGREGASRLAEHVQQKAAH